MEEIADKLWDKLGLYSVLEIQLARYCNEKNVARADLIAKCKQAQIVPSTLLYFSFIGYGSFVRICDTIMAAT